MSDFHAEIIGLHQHFEDYLSGKLEPDDTERFETVIHPGFTIIDSDGTVIDREEIISFVRDGHGQRPNFSIRAENIVLRQQSGDIIVVTYEEWQVIEDIRTVRASTVVFLEDSSKPEGLVWLHVHESGLCPVESE